MADRITYRPDPAAPEPGANALTPVIKIFTKDGQEHAHQVHSVPGDAYNPVGWDDIELKFRDCVSFTNASAADTDRAVDAVAQFETCNDAADIIHQLA